MSTKYTISNNFVENLISLVVRHKPKRVSIGRFNFAELRRVSREEYHPQLSFNPNNNTIIVKAETQIRNTKDFALFVTTYVESALVTDGQVSPNTVIFHDNYTQGEYVEDVLKKYGEWELQTQNLLTITTQGGFDETSIETQSPLLFGFIESQTGQPLRARFVNTSESFRNSISVEGLKPQSYIRTYRN